MCGDCTDCITKIFEGADSTRKLSFPMLTSLKDAIAEGTISPEHLRYTKFLLSER